MTAPVADARGSIRRNIWAGAAVTIVMVGSVIAWATATDISGAVIATGALGVDSNVRKVQHPSGGVIGEIFVRDGDRVTAGQVLVRLDDTITRANLAILTKGLSEMRARKARLEAERDDRATIDFTVTFGERAADPDIAGILAGERKLFDLRRAARAGLKSQLRERILQYDQEGAGLAAQAAAKDSETALIDKELAGARDLYAQNLYPITKLTQLEREATRLAGEKAQLIAASAQTRGRISETELQIVQIDRELASEVARELRDTEARISEFEERRIAAEDQLRRIDIRAPIDGTVHQSIAHTVGGVITASGEPLMLIVPENDSLIVDAKVATQFIDQLHVGQKALLRFSAFDMRATPEIDGTVSRISADAVTDQRTGAAYYEIRIALSAGEVARLGDVRLVPGMPVEAFVRTGERTVISYLMKPLSDQFARAFRER